MSAPRTVTTWTTGVTGFRPVQNHRQNRWQNRWQNRSTPQPRLSKTNRWSSSIQCLPIRPRTSFHRISGIQKNGV